MPTTRSSIPAVPAVVAPSDDDDSTYVPDDFAASPTRKRARRGRPLSASRAHKAARQRSFECAEFKCVVPGPSASMPADDDARWAWAASDVSDSDSVDSNIMSASAGAANRAAVRKAEERVRALQDAADEAGVQRLLHMCIKSKMETEQDAAAVRARAENTVKTCVVLERRMQRELAALCAGDRHATQLGKAKLAVQAGRRVAMTLVGSYDAVTSGEVHAWDERDVPVLRYVQSTKATWEVRHVWSSYFALDGVAVGQAAADRQAARGLKSVCGDKDLAPTWWTGGSKPLLLCSDGMHEVCHGPDWVHTNTDPVKFCGVVVDPIPGVAPSVAPSGATHPLLQEHTLETYGAIPVLFIHP